MIWKKTNMPPLTSSKTADTFYGCPNVRGSKGLSVAQGQWDTACILEKHKTLVWVKVSYS